MVDHIYFSTVKHGDFALLYCNEDLELNPQRGCQGNANAIAVES